MLLVNKQQRLVIKANMAVCVQIVAIVTGMCKSVPQFYVQCIKVFIVYSFV